MTALKIPTLSDYKMPKSKKVKPMCYEDTVECPEGHAVTVWRRLASSGKVVRTTCQKCQTVFDALAGPVPEDRKQRESDIERRLVQRVKTLGGEVRKVKWVGRSGAPDRLVMLPVMLPVKFASDYPRDFTIWIELKAPGGAATFPKNAHERAQHREHERMRKMGQRVEVVDSYERIEEVLS